jgi:hypothetical protein
VRSPFPILVGQDVNAQCAVSQVFGEVFEIDDEDHLRTVPVEPDRGVPVFDAVRRGDALVHEELADLCLGGDLLLERCHGVEDVVDRVTEQDVDAANVCKGGGGIWGGRWMVAAPTLGPVGREGRRNGGLLWRAGVGSRSGRVVLPRSRGSGEAG